MLTEKKREYHREYMARRRKLTGKVNKEEVNREKLTLPPGVVNSINDLVEHRLTLGLTDDREVRMERALEYHRWNEERLAERREYIGNHPRKELQTVSHQS